MRDVLRTAEIYSGERLEELPDLLVEWEREAGLSGVDSPKTGPIRKVVHRPRTGDHRPDGLLMVLAPATVPGRLPPVSITQLAPTVAALLGAPVPEGDAAPAQALAMRYLAHARGT